jgi:hypothetical protein
VRYPLDTREPQRLTAAEIQRRIALGRPVYAQGAERTSPYIRSGFDAGALDPLAPLNAAFDPATYQRLTVPQPAAPPETMTKTIVIGVVITVLGGALLWAVTGGKS